MQSLISAHRGFNLFIEKDFCGWIILLLSFHHECQWWHMLICWTQKIWEQFSTHLINNILACSVRWVSETTRLLIWIFDETRRSLYRNGTSARLLTGRTHHVFLGYSFLLNKVTATLINLV
jgi:hypothetical protein